MEGLTVQEKDQTNVEIELAEPVVLEGAILVHGFKGNIDKEEVKTVRQLLERGALVSPSKRDLDEVEIRRMNKEAPMDFNRVCFHCTYEGQNRDLSYSYRGEALLALPVSSGDNKVIAPDPLLGVSDVSMYSRGGVEIPLNEGILLMTEKMKVAVEDLFPVAAARIGISEEDFIRNNIIVVEDDVIGDPKKSWGETSGRIKPAKNVTYPLPTLHTVQQYDANNLCDLYDKLLPATKEQLGS